MSVRELSFWLSGGPTNTSPSLSVGGQISSAPPSQVSLYTLSNNTPIAGITFKTASLYHLSPTMRASIPALLDCPKSVTITWGGNTSKTLKFTFPDYGTASSITTVTESGWWVVQCQVSGTANITYDTMVFYVDLTATPSSSTSNTVTISIPSVPVNWGSRFGGNVPFYDWHYNPFINYGGGRNLTGVYILHMNPLPTSNLYEITEKSYFYVDLSVSPKTVYFRIYDGSNYVNSGYIPISSSGFYTFVSGRVFIFYYVNLDELGATIRTSAGGYLNPVWHEPQVNFVDYLLGPIYASDYGTPGEKERGIYLKNTSSVAVTPTIRISAEGTFRIGKGTDGVGDGLTTGVLTNSSSVSFIQSVTGSIALPTLNPGECIGLWLRKYGLNSVPASMANYFFSFDLIV